MATINITIDIDSQGANYVVSLKLEQSLLIQQELLSEHLSATSLTPEEILSRVNFAAAADRESDDFKEIANTLEGWLFPHGPLRDEWEKLTKTHRHENLRLWLHVRESSTLAELPWELAKTPLGIRLGSACGLCRLVVPVHEQGMEAVWPLRMLLLTGGKDIDGKLGIQNEMDAIQKALLPFGRSIQVVQLCTPSRKELSETVREFRPHVLH